MDVKIIDKDGTWFVNRAQFRFVDPTEREDGEKVYFEPGKPTRVARTKWIEGQELIVAINDPFTDEPPAVIETETLLKPNPDDAAANANAGSKKR